MTTSIMAVFTQHACVSGIKQGHPFMMDLWCWLLKLGITICKKKTVIFIFLCIFTYRLTWIIFDVILIVISEFCYSYLQGRCSSIDKIRAKRERLLWMVLYEITTTMGRLMSCIWVLSVVLSGKTQRLHPGYTISLCQRFA